MNIQVITLFPEMFEQVFGTSMLWKASDKGHVNYNLINLRDFGLGTRKVVDDTPYGGGPGMVLRVEPLTAAIEYAKTQAPEAKVVLMAPVGKQLNQKTAQSLAAANQDLIFVCGRYEGYDERIMPLIDQVISIGDYVLTGGELAAMVVVDAAVRLIPGVLGSDESAQDETFSEGLLEYPQYTRPDEFRGASVPEVLQSGNHAKIADWRKKQSLQKTKKNRPDLL